MPTLTKSQSARTKAFDLTAEQQAAWEAQQAVDTLEAAARRARRALRWASIVSIRLKGDAELRSDEDAAAPYHSHTLPPDVLARLANQRSLVNTYCTSDLCRPRTRTRRPRAHSDRSVFAITRSGAGVDLPGFGRCRSDMSDHEDALADRGAPGNRACRTAESDDEHDQRLWHQSAFPSDDAAFARCRVKSHEDFPRHIYRLFLILGNQFRWVLMRGPLAHALVSQGELAIDNAKEHTWMAMYEHDRDTLEDILYRLLQDLWGPTH